MQINFIINRIYKHCMNIENAIFNPLMFIVKLQKSLQCLILQ